MKCANAECKKDPSKSINKIIVNDDGDMACDQVCKTEYEKQKKDFFDNIGYDDYFEKWMGVDEI
jgi:hypothetical protein